jgi:fibronectin type 3 domain-containing protein
MNRRRASFLAVLGSCLLTLVGCGSSSKETPPAPPAAPTGLTATPANGAVTLAWTASSGATSYKVYAADTSGALASKTLTATVTSGVTCAVEATNAVTHYYQVTAVNSAGESGGSNEASATPTGAMKPLAPTGVAATPALSQVTVTWTDVPGATSYNVYWSTTPGVTTASPTKAVGVTSPHVVTALTNGTPYYFAVTAVAGAQESNLSAEVSATPNMAPPYISATALRWAGSVALNAPVVQVRVCSDATCSTNVTDATVTVNGTAATWTAGSGEYRSSQVLAAGAPVTMSVVVPSGSVAAAGTYTASGTMYATAPTVTAPTSATTWDNAVAHTVTWTAGAPTATTPASLYVIGVQDSAGTFYPINANTSPSTAAITASSFTLPAGTLPSAGTYTVFVGIGTLGIVDSTGGGIAFTGAAANSSLYIGSCSALTSFTVTAAVPAAPAGLTATASSGNVALSWTASSSATSYEVYRGTTPGGLGAKTVIATISGTTYDDATASNGVTYYYQVVATNGNGSSPASSQVSATPGPLPYVEGTVIHWELPMPGGVPIQQVRVCTDSSCGTVVSNATVTVNANTLTWNGTRGEYTGNVMPAVSFLQTLTVTIPTGSIVASGTYTATGTSYASPPTLTAPTAATTWSRAVANDVTWGPGAPTSTTPASVYVVGIADGTGTFYPIKTNNSPTSVAIGSTSFTVPAGTLPAAGTYVVFVGIGTTGIVDQGGGIPIAGAAAGSGFYLGYVAPTVTFTVTN